MGLLVPGFSVLLLLSWVLASEGGDISFYRNYKVTWGANNVLSLDQGREIQLSMDASSGYHPLPLVLFLR